MNISVIVSQFSSLLTSGDGMLPWLLVALLLFALALLGQKRARAARRQTEQARRHAVQEDLGGNSYFMPLPKMEQAVEIANPVEIASLLKTEDPPEPVVPPPPARGTTASQADAPLLVRDLLLTWFEARGYRSSVIGDEFHPIERQLQHRSEPGRHYAFAVEQDHMTPLRAMALLKLARSAGQDRLLIAAEQGCDPSLARELRQHGIRVFDQDSMRAELEKIDLRIAAKIIAVARGRALLDTAPLVTDAVTAIH
jgi:hypothetical protein